MSVFDNVVYGTLVLDGEPDANDISWCVSDIEGWDETPPLAQSTLHPTGQDREVLTSSRLAARPLVLRGTADATCDEAVAAVNAAYDRLSGLSWPLLTPKALTVTEPGSERTVQVVPAGGVRKRWAGERSFIFEVPLLAEDPLKYSVAVDTLALPDTVPMLGNFPSAPVLTLPAGGAATITNTTQGAGATLILGAVPAGTIVDMSGRTVTAPDGSDLYAQVDSTSVWWTLLPGNNVIAHSGAAVDISWRDAWL